MLSTAVSQVAISGSWSKQTELTKTELTKKDYFSNLQKGIFQKGIFRVWFDTLQCRLYSPSTTPDSRVLGKGGEVCTTSL